MALLTALLQGATPAERKVGIHPVTGWGGQELVGAVLRAVGQKDIMSVNIHRDYFFITEKLIGHLLLAVYFKMNVLQPSKADTAVRSYNFKN